MPLHPIPANGGVKFFLFPSDYINVLLSIYFVCLPKPAGEDKYTFVHLLKESPILFIFLFQERIKRSQQFGFIYHTACAPQYFSVSEKHQRRHDWMRYWLAVTPYLSTSTLMIRMRSPNTLFTCSRMGCIALQGWHHVAKKSTRTSWPLFITLLNVSIIIYLFP